MADQGDPGVEEVRIMKMSAEHSLCRVRQEEVNQSQFVSHLILKVVGGVWG